MKRNSILEQRRSQIAKDAEFQKELKEEAREAALKLGTRLDKGRHYLMSVEPKDLNVGDALEAFGFTRDGLYETE